jgi:predicted RNA-binding Zn ribbon-like protein
MISANFEEGAPMPPADIPAHAALLVDYANTLDVSDHLDDLATPPEVSRWLFDKGLLPRHAPADESDLALARGLRDAVRAAFVANHDGAGMDRGTDPDPHLEQLASRLPLAVQIRAGRPLLSPIEDGVAGGLSRLLVAAADAGADGSWRRLKICAADDCAWAFYDTSKNRSRTWCSMQVCGNRKKTREYRARRSASA